MVWRVWSSWGISGGGGGRDRGLEELELEWVEWVERAERVERMVLVRLSVSGAGDGGCIARGCGMDKLVLDLFLLLRSLRVALSSRAGERSRMVDASPKSPVLLWSSSSLSILYQLSFRRPSFCWSWATAFGTATLFDSGPGEVKRPAVPARLGREPRRASESASTEAELGISNVSMKDFFFEGDRESARECVSVPICGREPLAD